MWRGVGIRHQDYRKLAGEAVGYEPSARREGKMVKFQARLGHPECIGQKEVGVSADTGDGPRDMVGGKGRVTGSDIELYAGQSRECC